jgi:hypothetical protein
MVKLIEQQKRFDLGDNDYVIVHVFSSLPSGGRLYLADDTSYVLRMAPVAISAWSVVVLLEQDSN